MMTLADFFKLQATFNERVGLNTDAFFNAFSDNPSSNIDQEFAEIRAGKWIDDMLKAMSSEIEELRNCTYWKHWCQEAQSGQRYRVKDVEAARREVIDILHFWISLAQILGMTPEMVCEMYSAKLAKNLRRQDDGYSVEVKDKAWQLFLEAQDSDSMSLEDLPEDVAEHYLSRAKRILKKKNES